MVKCFINNLFKNLGISFGVIISKVYNIIDNKKTVVTSYKLFFVSFAMVVVISFLSHVMYSQIHKESTSTTVKNVIKTAELNEHIISDVNLLQDTEEEYFQNDVITVKEGDTLVGILKDTGLEDSDSYFVANAASKVYNFSQLKVGQRINLDFKEWRSSITDKKLNICTMGKKVEVFHDNVNNTYAAKLSEAETYLKNNLVQGAIEISLYDSALSLGAPPNIIMQYIKLLSYELDFQRDIAPGANFKILYDYLANSNDEKVQSGQIIYASLTTRDKSVEIYRYRSNDGNFDYFHKNGANLRTSLLRTPVKKAYISSGYGIRKHPILGYSKMHKGLDYAAARGTPVYAAGNGIVQEIKRTRGYGRYIKIKHNRSYATLYAHLDRFNNNLKRGVKIKQGDVIGFVGATGMATGPHLHYEVHKNGKQVNPAKVNFPISAPLKGRELLAFQSQQKQIDKMIQHEFYLAEVNTRHRNNM